LTFLLLSGTQREDGALGRLLIRILVIWNMQMPFVHGADVVLTRGIVHTVNDNMPQAQAIAISNGKIIFVGSSKDVREHIGYSTVILNLRGKTVLPGFVDSHYHYMGVGKRDYQLNLDNTTSLSDLQQRIRQKAKSTAEGEWIIGRGWNEQDWPNRVFPTAADIDSIIPGFPVFLTRTDGHAVVVNSEAMRIAGIDTRTSDPQGGQILRDLSGSPTGMLIDNAIGLVSAYLPPDTSQVAMRNYATKANEVTLANGITQVHDMGSKLRDIGLWHEMFENDELQVRINAYVPGPGRDMEHLLANGTASYNYGDWITVKGIKLFLDGALGSRGAALLEPYHDSPGSGLLIHEQDTLLNIIREALHQNIQIAAHAIGDKANRLALDLFERAFDEENILYGREHTRRFRIEHAQVVAPQDVPRFAALGIIPSMQPSHAVGDLSGFALDRLGIERMDRAYAWRAFLDSGCKIAAGSDAPVEAGDPIFEFYAATVRKDPAGASGEGWHPEQRMIRQEALKGLTIWGARAAFMEDITGSIEVGKAADLVVLDRDILSVPDDELLDTKVVMTLSSGRVVYSAENEIISSDVVSPW
jgi:hypothetical protein